MCLGYLNERVNPPKWECQDSCLSKGKDGYCGKTNHFTSFAVLLDSSGGGGGGKGPCASSGSPYNIYTWLTLAFVLFAILVVTFCILVYEAWCRYKKYKYTRDRSIIERKTSRLLAQDSKI